MTDQEWLPPNLDPGNESAIRAIGAVLGEELIKSAPNNIVVFSVLLSLIWSFWVHATEVVWDAAQIKTGSERAVGGLERLADMIRADALKRTGGLS